MSFFSNNFKKKINKGRPRRFHWVWSTLFVVLPTIETSRLRGRGILLGEGGTSYVRYVTTLRRKRGGGGRGIDPTRLCRPLIKNNDARNGNSMLRRYSVETSTSKQYEVDRKVASRDGEKTKYPYSIDADGNLFKDCASQAYIS